MKKVKTNKQSHTSSAKKGSGDWHVSNSSMGMGDYYGSGIRNPMGRMREGLGQVNVSQKGLKKPPKSLA